MNDVTFRPAQADEAEELADIILETSEGIVPHLLDKLIPLMKSRSLLATVLRSEDSHFSYTNMVLAKHESEIAGLLFAYPASEQGIPGLMETFLPAKRLEPVRAILTEAEPNTLYVNTFWVNPHFRGRGLSDALMDYARTWAEEAGQHGISLHCWADNEHAKRFYSRQGFAPVRHLAANAPLDERHPEGSDIWRLDLAQ